MTHGGNRLGQDVPVPPQVPFEKRCGADEHAELAVPVMPGATLLGSHVANVTAVLVVHNHGEVTHNATVTVWHCLEMVFRRARATAVGAPVPMSTQCPQSSKTPVSPQCPQHP